MSTLMITTPGMGKTYLVKEMKRRGILALDFDIKGSKPTDEDMWESAKQANTQYINAAFNMGYEYITTWPNSFDPTLLNRDVKLMFVIPVGDAWTGCMLRIAARQPGTPFIADIEQRYHDLIDKLEETYLEAVNTHDDVTRIIVTRAHDTLIDVWASVNTIGYKGGRFLDVSASFSPVTAIEAILPKQSKTYANEIFYNCLSPEIVSDITFAIDLEGSLQFIDSSAYGFAMFSCCTMKDLSLYVPEDSEVQRVINTCGSYHIIIHDTLVESDEMGDWTKRGYTFIKNH